MNENVMNTGVFPDHIVLSKIFIIRDHKVMIDRDLAELYGVETRMLNQAVKRNLQKFPGDFMFQMTSEELAYWKSQILISNKEKMGIRKPPLLVNLEKVANCSNIGQTAGGCLGQHVGGNRYRTW